MKKAGVLFIVIKKIGKSLSLILCVILIVSCVASHAESVETIEISATYTKAVSHSLKLKELISSVERRALLTVCMALDYQISLGNDNPPFDVDIFFNPSYVGRYGFVLVSVFFSESEKRGLIIAYDTLEEDHCYYYIKENIVSRNALEAALYSDCIDGCFRNDVEDLYKAYTEVYNMAINKQ